MNKGRITDNIRDHAYGAEPFIYTAGDVGIRMDKQGNSWFWVGHFEEEGQTLNFMYHLSVLQLSKRIPVRMINSVLSITDETGKVYLHEDRFYKAKKGEVATKGLQINTERDLAEGDLEQMHIRTSMPNGAIDMTMIGEGYPLFNLCTGYFMIAGVPNYQYSIPSMKTKGRIVIYEREYPVEGMVWFDRQFAGMPKGKKIKGGYNCKWVWMDIHFDNDEDVISLFGVTELATGKENCWATVLHPDGMQSGAAVEPMVDDSFDVWESDVTGMKYPTGWNVNIPEWGCAFTVKSVLKEQEIVSEDPAGRKYEGASRIRGIYRGKEVTGYCCLELVGGWN